MPGAAPQKSLGTAPGIKYNRPWSGIKLDSCLRELNENWTSNLSIHTHSTYLFTLNINNATQLPKRNFLSLFSRRSGLILKVTSFQKNKRMQLDVSHNEHQITDVISHATYTDDVSTARDKFCT